jgi:DNA-binding transcriptional LysR family regulator
VAHEGHFGRAAERLHVTTSPVSRAVKELERDLGGDLFVRRYHQVELTTAGRHLLARAEPILADLDGLRAEMRRLTQTAARTIQIGGTHLAPPAVLRAVVSAAEKADPEYPLDVTLAPSADLLSAVAGGDIDLAVVHLPIDDPALSVLPVATYRLKAVLRGDDPLAGASRLHCAELAGHTYVTMTGSVQPVAMEHLGRELAARGITRVEAVPAADILMIVAKVRRRGSVTFIPVEDAFGRMFDDPDLVTIPLTDAPEMQVGMVWRNSEPLDHAIAGIIALVAAEQ